MMYETFEDAKRAAEDVIARIYGGNKYSCVVVESRKGSPKWFSFRFYSDGTNGKFVPCPNGSIERRTKI
jgi:hypothetical protein